MKRSSLLVIGSVAITVGLQWSGEARQDRSAPSPARLVQHFDEALLSKPTHRVRIEK
jgi:hypothetical protein